MCLAQRHNAVMPVRLEPTALRSRVKHSTTEPLRSLHMDPDEHTFESKIVIVFLSSTLNICLGCSKGGDVSFEYLQHMVWLRNKQINS